MKYLLDTCVISDFVKGEQGTLTKLKSIPPIELAISSITVMEIHYGLSLNPQRARKIKNTLLKIIEHITILNYSESVALKTAKIRAHLKQQGTPIGSYDLLIAGTALDYDLIMVTANEKEFARIPSLQIENWQN